MKKSIKIIIFLIIVGLIAYGILTQEKDNFSFKEGKNKESSQGPPSANGDSVDGSGKNIAEYLDTKNWKSYDGTDFSFKYTSSFKVSNSPVEGGEMTTAEDENFGFQVFAALFDEKGPITPERIWQDLPDAVVDEPKVADLDGADTLVFYGYDDDLGDTFEAWTVRKGKLYQIMTTKEAEELLIEVLNTWNWN